MMAESDTQQPRFNWKLVLVLWAMGTLGAIAVVPYLLELLGASAAQVPLPILAIATVIQYSLLSLIAAVLGYILSRRIGLGVPILERLTRGEWDSAQFKSILPISVILGIVGAILIAALDLFVFAPLLRAELGEAFVNSLNGSARPNPWFGLLASFEGGIVEELLLRFFLFSLLAWLGSFVLHTPDRRPTLAVLWVANILAAILFGLGHLPATVQLGLPPTPLVITRAVVLNGALGVAFGYLYWTRGLEAAMLAHFSADVVLHFALAFLG